MVVNDAATLPASLPGRTADGAPFELRLSAPLDGLRLVGVLFGGGDWRTRTEDRPAPPGLAPGAVVAVGALTAVVAAVAGRRVELDVRVDDAGDRTAALAALWRALYASAAPVHSRTPVHTVAHSRPAAVRNRAARTKLVSRSSSR